MRSSWNCDVAKLPIKYLGIPLGANVQKLKRLSRYFHYGRWGASWELGDWFLFKQFSVTFHCTPFCLMKNEIFFIYGFLKWNKIISPFYHSYFILFSLTYKTILHKILYWKINVSFLMGRRKYYLSIFCSLRKWDNAFYNYNKVFLGEKWRRQRRQPDFLGSYSITLGPRRPIFIKYASLLFK